ncbi:MAG: hypothetical protein GX774_15060 [Armatimonadetes bacterium]|nr:hypothetical protein [Armatimonadota bacterium]
MRISTLACGLLCAALAWAGPAAAQRGPGVEEAGEEQRFVPAGLVLNPTAYMLPANQWLIGAGTFQQAVVTGSSDRQYSASLFRGFNRNFHAGVFWTGVRRDRIGRDDIVESYFGASAQYQFVNEGRGLTPALSLGGYAYTGPGSGATTYLVASKNLSGEVRPGAIFLHAGARWDTFDNDLVDGSAIRPFVGANFLLTENLALLGEFRWSHFGETDDPWSLGAIYNIGGGLAITAGVQDPGSGDTSLFVGLTLVP